MTNPAFLTIQSVAFAAAEPGPRVLILGAVHGNEKCGSHAIRRMLKDLEEGRIVIERGAATFVPVCNPRAFAEDVRWIDRNLNRYLIPQEKPDSYEARIGNLLCPLLEKCDFLLDLHSYHSGNGSFTYVGTPGSKEHIYANSLGATSGVTGWAAAYAASGRERKKTDPDESTGTTEYARRFGAIAATLECGQHKDPQAVDVAYRAICRALHYTGLVSRPLVPAMSEPTKLVEIKQVFYRGEGGSFARDWKEFDAVKRGEVIAVDENGGEVTVPDDGYIVLPHAAAPPGSEWFYWGRERKSA